MFVEAAFRTLKGDLGLRPIDHHKPERLEAHRCVAFLAYGLSITLRQRLKALAGGWMPRVVFGKLATQQRLDGRVPTTDGRERLLVRRTAPARAVALLLARLHLEWPPPTAPAPPRGHGGPKQPAEAVARFGPPLRKNPSKIPLPDPPSAPDRKSVV